MGGSRCLHESGKTFDQLGGQTLSGTIHGSAALTGLRPRVLFGQTSTPGVSSIRHSGDWLEQC